MAWSRVLVFCALVAASTAQPGMDHMMGNSAFGREIIGGQGVFPSQGGAGAGERFSDGTRNGWDGNPNMIPGMGHHGGGIGHHAPGLDHHGPVGAGIVGAGIGHVDPLPMPVGHGAGIGPGHHGRVPEFLDPVTGRGVHLEPHGHGPHVGAGLDLPVVGHDIFGGDIGYSGKQHISPKKPPVLPKKPKYPSKKNKHKPFKPHKPIHKPHVPHKPMHKPVMPHKPIHKPIMPHKPMHEPYIPHKPMHEPYIPHKPMHKPYIPHKPIHKPKPIYPRKPVFRPKKPVIPPKPVFKHKPKHKPIKKPVYPKYPHKSVIKPKVHKPIYQPKYPKPLHKPHIHNHKSLHMSPLAHDPFGYDDDILHKPKKPIMPHKDFDHHLGMKKPRHGIMPKLGGY